MAQQLKAVKEYFGEMHEWRSRRPREAEREGRVLDDLAAAKRKVDVFAGGTHAAAQLWSDELLTWAPQGDLAAREEISALGAFVADSNQDGPSPPADAARRAPHRRCTPSARSTAWARGPTTGRGAAHPHPARAGRAGSIIPTSEAAALPAVSVLPEPGASGPRDGALPTRAPAPEIDERARSTT